MRKQYTTIHFFLTTLAAILFCQSTFAQQTYTFSSGSQIHLSKLHNDATYDTQTGYTTSDFTQYVEWINIKDSLACPNGVSNILVSGGHSAGYIDDYFFMTPANTQIDPNTYLIENDRFQLPVGPGCIKDIVVTFAVTGTSCDITYTTGVLKANTDAIHAPKITAPAGFSTYNGANVTNLYWRTGSDIPNNPNMYFKVYRNGTLIGTVPSMQATSPMYIDSTVLQTGTYTYTVTEYTPRDSAPVFVSPLFFEHARWNAQESNPSTVIANINNELLHASDSAYYGKTNLSWPNMAGLAPNDISVLRNGVQIAVVNKNATQYNDFDGIPGVKYKYTIAPINANNQTPLTFSDSGSAKPNGVLSGYVRSVQGTGIQGVTLTATGTVRGVARSYAALTDPSGYYKIKDISYDTAADYTVVASKGTDQFNPSSVTRSLDLINFNVSIPDIYDTTVFTVSGHVTFSNTTCPVGGAALYVNGTSTNTVSDASGYYSFIAQNPGNYAIRFKYLDHTFDTVNVLVSSNTPNVNIYDTKTDTLILDLKNGCQSRVVDSATFLVKSGTCFSQSYHFNGTDPITLVLPAQKYTVSISSAMDSSGPNGNIIAMASIDADLSHRDTISLTTIDTVQHIRAAYNDTITLVPVNIIHHPADTTASIDTLTRDIAPARTADFMYHGTLTVTLSNIDFFCGGYVADQRVNVPVVIRAEERSYYRGITSSCPVDTATVRIFDDVSGAGLTYITLNQGRAVYNMLPGEPNTPDNSSGPHQHRKQFNVFVSSGVSHAAVDAWIFIRGDKRMSDAYVSSAPPMPLMVLHDPPGSNSYTSYQKDSTFSINISNYIDTTINMGGYGNIKIGKAFETPFGKIPGLYLDLSISAGTGDDNNSTSSYNTTFTASQTISTSGDPAFIGRDADVYIGGTLNTKYADAFYLTIDENTCVVKDTIVTIWGLDSVSSQFAFTGKHIRETLLPQLDSLQAHAPPTRVAYFQNQINMWKQILKKDSIAIENAFYPNNITVSSGVSYDYTTQQDTSYENDYTYVATQDASFSAGAGYADGDLIDINAGFNMDFHTEHSTSTTTGGTNTTIFNYHLEDQVAGNHFSVGTGSDPNFGSPIFKIFSGATACPHEEGTQFRDKPTLSISPGVIVNVPPTQAAAFIATIGNQSETFETRTYTVQLDPNTNLDGATVKIGGQDITQFPASFTVPASNSINAALTVQKGPFADYYNDLGIVVSSACDEDISVTVPITVHFQSECSDVSIAQPANNWLLNASGNNQLHVVLTGYNAANPNLQEIGIQYRASGTTQLWNNGPSIPDSLLTVPMRTVALNTTNLPDGRYEIRAYAKCQSPQGTISYTYSPTLSGLIDRQSFSLFGTPEPANGILNRGDNISVQFNDLIDCNQLYGHIVATLRTADSNILIRDTFACNGNGLVLTVRPPFSLDSFDGKTLIASVSNVFDQNGNGISDPIEWSFIVNRAEVYWNPSNMTISNTIGTTASGIGTLVNKAITAKGFTILSSTLLTPSLFTDTIQPNGQDSIRFTVTNALNPGTYYDTIRAMVGNLQAKLFVKLDVLLPSPNWSVNPANYQYSMSITTNFSTTNANTPLSTDRRDKVAAFKGNECRGVGSITYDPQAARYAAFITAYSNSSIGDTFTFRMWDAMPGTEYQAAEKLQFIDNGIIGQTAAPYILHPGGVFQTIPLAAGWNWFSLDVSTPTMTPASVLSSITANNGAIIKGQNSYDQYTNATTGWTGSLATMDHKSSYMIQLDHADTLHVLGQQINDTSIVQVATGWNWIGFPRHKITTASSFLANLNVANGDFLKSQTQFTQYNAGSWSGSLNYMYPGQGYKLKAANAINFVIAPDRSLPSWNDNQYTFQQNMSVTADLQFNGVSTTQSHYLVGAFANGICIGTAQPEYIAALNVYRVFITAHGDTANVSQAITFKVYDTDNDIEYTATHDPLSVVPDTTVARVEAPYVINVQTATGVNAITYTEGYSLLQNVPNPFAKNTAIEYAIPAAQHVTLTVYDESGRIVAELVNGQQAAGKHRVSFVQENLQSGVYFYQMKSGDFVKTRRMLIIR